MRIRNIIAVALFLCVAAIAVEQEPSILPHYEHMLQFGKVENPPVKKLYRPTEVASPSELTHEIYAFLPY